MNGLLVHRAPPLAVVQDLGRIGYRSQGITRGGPLDPWSHQWANALLGNRPDAAALEISLGGLEVEAMIDMHVAVTGTPVPLAINGAEAPLWQGLRLRPGDRLLLGSDGARRNTLAVAGGFDTARVLGSRATVLRERLGGLGDGLQAKPIRAQDFLPCRPSHIAPTRVEAPPHDDLLNDRPLRVVPLIQPAGAGRAARRTLFNELFEVSRRADRMACRLEGAALPDAGEVTASFGVVPGCIQVPPDGQPIVLLADCQTMGGYPVLGAVISADLPSLGWAISGDALRFAPVTPDAARWAWQLYQETLPAG